MATQQTPSNDRAVATMPECNTAEDEGVRKIQPPDRNRNGHPGCNIGRTLGSVKSISSEREKESLAR